MPFGLDISDRSLRLVMIKKRRGKAVITSASEIALPAGLIKDGEILNQEKVASHIRELLQNTKPKKPATRGVVACLPEGKSFIKVISVLKSKDTKNAILNEINKHFPYPTDEVYIDWQPLSAKSDDYQYLLAGASPRVIVDSYIDTLTKAQLVPTILEIESVAIARSLVPDPSSIADPFLIIDIGRDRSTFIVFNQGVIYFTSSTKAFAGNVLTRNIKNELAISNQEAQTLKQKVGYNSKNWEGKIKEALTAPLNQFISLIKEIFAFYIGHYKNTRPIAKVILTGGGAKTPQLSEVLSAALKIECIALSPKIKVLGGANKVINGQNIYSFNTAIGLALRGANKNDHS